MIKKIESKEKRVILKRISPPNKYDQHAKDTECFVIVNDKIKEKYVQTSSDESKPDWQLKKED